MGKRFMAYLGQHKSGSTWLNRITLALARKVGLTFEAYNKPTDFEHKLRERIEVRRLDGITWNNAEWSVMDELDFRAFHVVRDPRDVLVSAYYSHVKTHPTRNWPQLAEYRPFLEHAAIEDALFMEIGFIPDVFRRLREWQVGDPRILDLRLEDISSDPIDKLRQAYEFIGMFDAGLRERDFIKVVNELRFEKLSGGRKQGEEDLNSHFRKGTSGDWKNHFNERHVTYFKAAMSDILIKYGYERDENWYASDPSGKQWRAAA